MGQRIGALEAGGTKMVMGIFDEAGREINRETIPTEHPEKTMPEIIRYFKKNQISALGIGSFGPLELDPNSPQYGDMTATPKPGWSHFPLLRILRDELKVPMRIDTDVNAAVWAEQKIGAAKGCSTAVYVTVGTGIGAGICVNGEVIHGMLHPEVGHMLLRAAKEETLPQGVCPYHDGCLEGLASGKAILARIDGSPKDLADEHPVWALEAHYLAQMCVNLILTVSPHRILLGGGVMQRQSLFPRIRKETAGMLNGYVQTRQILEEMDTYITAPALYPDSGLIGSWLLGLEALREA